MCTYNSSPFISDDSVRPNNCSDTYRHSVSVDRPITFDPEFLVMVAILFTVFRDAFQNLFIRVSLDTFFISMF